MFPALANHLWQSTLFAAAIALLTLLLRTTHARTRHALWFVASLKFMLPFSLLVTLGSQIEWRAPQPDIPVVLEQFSQPFPETATHIPTRMSDPTHNLTPTILLTLWLCGSCVVIANWSIRWRRIRTALQLASPLNLPIPMRAISSPALLEPGVFGIYRPLLLLPEGILNHLTPPQLEAVIAHELCHVRRRDNLAALVHMLVEAAFWFHPLVWWIGVRLIDERERACDEEVLRQGSEPQVYAESILQVCKLYFESPVECVSGITGADLKRRIESIMTYRAAANLDPARRFLLALLAAAALAGPVMIGLLHAPVGLAQAPTGDTQKPAFEVASVKPNKSGSLGVSMNSPPGFAATNASLRNLIEAAYDVKDYQISGSPGWLNDDRFDIVAKCPSEPYRLTLQRVQSLLEDRFKLTLHWDSKVAPGFALVAAKSGLKLHPAAPGKNGRSFEGDGRSVSAKHATLANLADWLARRIGQPVVNMTGNTDFYDFKLEWTLDDTAPAAKPPEERGQNVARAEFFDAILPVLQEQLGVKLEARKVPVPVLVIDHVERTPTEN